jgi:hypothetical protein
MKLSLLLKLQIAYMALGILYNLVSLYVMSTGKPALTATQPAMGILSMAVYGLFLIPGFMRKLTVYRILMVVAILVIGYGGIVVHFINIFTQPQIYQSILAWAIAVGINIFGLVLNLIAALGKYKV